MATVERATQSKHRKPTKKLEEECCDDHSPAAGAFEHPDHSRVLARLSRLQGQMGGVEKMISQRRYCLDILIQLRAASAALRGIEAAVLETHLRGCVKTAMQSKRESEIEKKIQEILDLTLRR